MQSDIDKLIDSILASRSINEIMAAVAALAVSAGDMDDILVWVLCQQLVNRFVKWAKPYERPASGAAWNAVIVPPEHAPVMLLPSCVPFGGSSNDVIHGLKNFAARCDEFTPPVYDAITTAEIKRVLNAAQREFMMLDVIAPNDPLRILRFNNSHVEHNSQCGFPANPERPSTIFLYHPRENETYDRVFIFAHELGHALHFSLTRDIEIMPEGFDELNESIRIKFQTQKEKQEAFADATALALLNVKGLGTHFPTPFSKALAPCFARYLRELIYQ